MNRLDIVTELRDLKVGTHTRGPVPATSPLKSLPEGTGRRDLSYEQFIRNVLRNKSQGLNYSKQFESVGLVAGTKL